MKSKLISIFAGLLTAAVLTVSGTSYAVGSAAFGVSSASATTGSNATVYVSEDGSNVSAVTVTYSYDTSKLQLVGSSCAGAFPSQVVSGTCSITPGSATVSGAQTVMALTFKAVAAGSASVTVTGSQIASNGANEWNGSAAAGTITVSNPVSTGGGGGGTSAGSHTSATGSKSSSTPSSNTNNQTASNATTTPTSTNTTSTPNTGNSSKTSTATGQVKGASTTRNVSKLAASTTAHKSHVPQIPAGVYYVLLLLAVAAAAYWFTFRKYKYAVAVSFTATKKVAAVSNNAKAQAAPKGKLTNAKKTSAKPNKSKTVGKKK